MLTYAIGDIHGCFDLLRAALAAITRHAKGRPYELVLLGDYIDRGPDSRATVECLLQPRNHGRTICLMGNHEEMLIRFVYEKSQRSGAMWLETGGVQTLRSYGLGELDWAGAAQLPKPHLEWMVRRPTSYAAADRVYVHAGIDPCRPLDLQGRREYLWIRDEFLTADPGIFVESRHIVHGHTPVWAGKPRMEAPELLAHRTNLDTGAFATAVLAIGVFTTGQGGPVDVLMVT